MDEKAKKIVYMVLGVLFAIFLFLFFITSCSKKVKPEALENLIIKNAKKYYKIHEDELPSDGNTSTMSLTDLATKGVIKDVEKLVGKKTTCSGTLTIENNNNYYMYSPNIACTTNKKTYNSKILSETLLDDVVNEGNGLYQVGTKYYFRGDNVDNYLLFDGILWRIIGINEDNTVRLIEVKKRTTTSWDDRYNEDRKTDTGRNELVYNGINSRIKDNLDEIYESEKVLSNDAKGFIKKTTLCIGKRNETDTAKDGSIECNNTLENQYIGLLQINEYLITSLDNECTYATAQACKNYNYLADMGNSYWTLTADASTTHKVYKINGLPFLGNANSLGQAKIVINISENTSVTGKGTEEDPYIVTGTDTEIKKLDK